MPGPDRCCRARRRSSKARRCTGPRSGCSSALPSPPLPCSAPRQRDAFARSERSGGLPREQQPVHHVAEDVEHRVGIGTVDDRRVLGAEHGPPRDRPALVPEELDGDRTPSCLEVSHRDDLFARHGSSFEQVARQRGARILATPARLLAPGRKPARAMRFSGAAPIGDDEQRRVGLDSEPREGGPIAGPRAEKLACLLWRAPARNGWHRHCVASRAMQLSRFTVAYENVRPGEHVLYNVLEDRYVGIDEATRAAIARWTSGSEAVDAGERETQDVLLEDRFLVRGRDEDDERVRAHLEKASDGVPGTLQVTLMPTLQCNLACSYCFQKEHPAFTRMSSPTEDATLEWLLRRIDERGLRRLHVHYFGGEPTTRKDYCLRTAEVLSASMKARGGTFTWEMTTNGVHLDAAFAKQMESFGNGTFKVTLDGDKETHDRMRVYRDGRGSFDVIFENVVALARAGSKVYVSGHFFPDQAASFEKLLDRLEKSGVAKLLAGVMFRPMVDT